MPVCTANGKPPVRWSAGKTDQYSDADSAYDKDSELHRRLYGRSVRHPGDVFYVLVCRASLGCPITTAQTGRDARDADDANAKVRASLPRLVLRPSRALQWAGPSREAMTQSHARLQVFPVGFRELAGVAGVSPPIFHHSLFATAFPRYREIVIFHSECARNTWRTFHTLDFPILLTSIL